MRLRGDRHLGLRDDERAGEPWARHWNPQVAALSAEAQAAVLTGALPAPALPIFADARHLDRPGYLPFEGGFGAGLDGAMVVAIRTPLPAVTPAMIAWWFAWHSDDARRYKLWHPRAHVHAAWRSNVGPAQGYLGRTSIVDEYLGDRLGRFAIRFVAPPTLGLPPDDDRAITVCARVGLAEAPIDGGWLVHHVRRTPEGSEMRSRFWIGGPHVAARGGLTRLVQPLARAFVRPTRADAIALLVHCAEEMAHLGTFLPALHRAVA